MILWCGDFKQGNFIIPQCYLTLYLVVIIPHNSGTIQKPLNMKLKLIMYLGVAENNNSKKKPKTRHFELF